jgi:hypothetical protein
MDHRKLLGKYIEHVYNCEGFAFITDSKRRISQPDLFSDEEWAELEKIDGEPVEEGRC